MKVAFETRGPVDEPYLKLNEEQIVGMTLRAGSMEIGSRRSALQRISFDAGLMGLCPPQSEYWVGICDMTHVTHTRFATHSNRATCLGGDGRSRHPLSDE